MPKTILALFLALSWASLSPALEDPVWAFKFEDYAVTTVFQGKPAPPILATKNHKQFRTVIREAAAKGPSFAGHYAVAEWGCGTSCVQLAVVDSATGRIYDLPFENLIMSTSKKYDYDGPAYQLKSRLFIADGCPNEDEEKCGTYYYEWKNNQFKLLRFDPTPEAAK